MKLNLVFLLVAIIFKLHSNSQSEFCETMEPICSNSPNSYFLQTNVSNPDPSNNYGCLSQQPNPTWYYLKIETNGDLEMTLSAPADIDFIIWGPFLDLDDATSYCGQLGVDNGAPIVDCSYSGTSNETPSISNTQDGEIYIMLVTNYANSPQNVTLEQTTGSAETSCNLSENCNSNPGTFVIKKNGVSTTPPIYLCNGESFSIESNNDYILPGDTIFSPIGDYEGVVNEMTTAQLMWLVYTDMPTSNFPNQDPNFLGETFIVSTEDIISQNAVSDPLFQFLGGNCGTYFIVPVAGDDGVGNNNNIANGINDNGGLHWDKDGNGCYEFGTPIEITFACQIETNNTLNCEPGNQYSKIDIEVNGGLGNYSITNQGQGNIYNTTLSNPGIMQITNLFNNQNWNVDILDTAGCYTNVSGTFNNSLISNVDIVPASSCPTGIDGEINVILEPVGLAPYNVEMNNISTTGPIYSYNGPAGAAVETVIEDGNNCIYQQTETITSSSHFIDVNVTNLQNEECSGDGLGSAMINAEPIDVSGNLEGNITSIIWTHPDGSTISGNSSNTFQVGMVPGTWTVTVIDDFESNPGCEVTIPITINSPQELDVLVLENNDLNCFNSEDGEVVLDVIGGVFSQQPTYTWQSEDGLNTNVTLLNDNSSLNLNAGILEVFVTDDNGCQDSVEFTIIQPDEISTLFTTTNIDCNGEATGKITINGVTNNQGNVNYTWYLSPSTSPQNSSTATGLNQGVYSFIVKDEQDCEKEYITTISEAEALQFQSLTAVNCTNSQNNGVVEAIVTGGGNEEGNGTDYTYLWTNSYGSAHFENLWENVNSATYYITVTNDLGCTISDSITIDCESVGVNNLTNGQIIYFTENNETTFQLTSKVSDNLTFTLVDLNGKIILSQINFEQKQKVKANLKDGVYFYTVLSNDNYLMKKKIIIIN